MARELETAVGRLQDALRSLEAALERRLGEARKGDLETELQLMQDDRARLAVELESATARLTRVETATEHLGRRIGIAIGTIGAVLAEADGSQAAREA